jgi:hypothetical protein
MISLAAINHGDRQALHGKNEKGRTELRPFPD